MAFPLTADTTRVTVDGMRATADGRATPLVCPGLGAVPPSIADREASPTAEDLLPQILALTPRGPAWGTDEAGDGTGASPVQRGVWRGIAAWVADHLGRDFTAASQAFPSAVTYTLLDWEIELGLPDARRPTLTDAQRLIAVRSRFGALGPTSPNDFRCLAAGLGHTIRVEEPRQFRVDTSACVGPDVHETFFHAVGANPVEVGFSCDDGICSDTPLQSVVLGPALPGAGDRCGGGGVTEAGFHCNDGVCAGTSLDSFTLSSSDEGSVLEGLVLGRRTDPGEAVAGDPRAELGFACDDAVCGADPLESVGPIDPNSSVDKFFVAHAVSGGETAFRCDDGACDGDPIEGIARPMGLEDALRAVTPPHVQIVVSYA